MSEIKTNKQNETPMRVLWIAQSCSLQDKEDNPGLTGRMETLITEYCQDRIRLAVVYMADGIHDSKLSKQGIDYYGVNANLGVGSTDEEWEEARKGILQVVGDFHPDIIQCFGAEWPYGAIAESTEVPVVIHMMGFLNIYFPAIHMARGDFNRPATKRNRVKDFIRCVIHRNQPQESAEDRCARMERTVMIENRYFFGRTQWDRNIVRYYSQGSIYYYLPEMIKPFIYNAAGQWTYHFNGKIRLLSVSSADDRKGNEIILRTAEILRNLMHLEVEWRVAGHKDFLAYFEQRTGIRHETVGIELLGMVSCNEIIRELKSADLFIHPSIMDNSPHAVCEAQLIGCPVIASAVGGVPDLVESGKTGFLYPYNEPHTLAFLIANIYNDRDLLTSISENEVQEARTRHNPERIAEMLYQSYSSIIEDNKYGK